MGNAIFSQVLTSPKLACIVILVIAIIRGCINIVQKSNKQTLHVKIQRRRLQRTAQNLYLF